MYFVYGPVLLSLCLLNLILRSKVSSVRNKKSYFEYYGVIKSYNVIIDKTLENINIKKILKENGWAVLHVFITNRF